MTYEARTMFKVISIGALYAGSERGLAADVLSVRALGGSALTVCTSIVAAGPSGVTDVTEVPADTVDAQLEHALKTAEPDAVKIGIIGAPETAAVVFKRLARSTTAPVVLDLTLSGPSGEDVAGGRVRDLLLENLGQPDLVTIRRTDAELMAGMEIQSLDDAQVAAQRLHRAGARRVLIRAGRLPVRFFDPGDSASDQMADLFFDGSEFSLFEAPFVPAVGITGASSAFLMCTVKNLSSKQTYEDAIQNAKLFVTEALRHTTISDSGGVLNVFWRGADRFG